MRVSGLRWAASLGLMAGPSFCPTAFAEETTSYTYDALGRLTSVAQSGGPSSGTKTCYTYDAAGNRTNVTVTNPANCTDGSSGGGPGGGSGGSGGTPASVYVVTLNGLSVVPFIQ